MTNKIPIQSKEFKIICFMCSNTSFIVFINIPPKSFRFYSLFKLKNFLVKLNSLIIPSISNIDIDLNVCSINTN